MVRTPEEAWNWLENFSVEDEELDYTMPDIQLGYIYDITTEEVAVSPKWAIPLYEQAFSDSLNIRIKKKKTYEARVSKYARKVKASDAKKPKLLTFKIQDPHASYSSLTKDIYSVGRTIRAHTKWY